MLIAVYRPLALWNDAAWVSETRPNTHRFSLEDGPADHHGRLARAICVESAIHVARISQSYIRHHNVSYMWPAAMQHMSTAATVLIAHAASIEGPMCLEDPLQRLQTLREFLAVAATMYLPGQRMLNTLDLMLNELSWRHSHPQDTNPKVVSETEKYGLLTPVEDSRPLDQSRMRPYDCGVNSNETSLNPGAHRCDTSKCTMDERLETPKSTSGPNRAKYCDREHATQSHTAILTLPQINDDAVCFQYLKGHAEDPSMGIPPQLPSTALETTITGGPNSSGSGIPDYTLRISEQTLSPTQKMPEHVSWDELFQRSAQSML
jgi:hypothetical protein